LVLANVVTDTQLMEEARLAAAEIVFTRNGKLHPQLAAAVRETFGTTDDEELCREHLDT
jgi:hypothetical protein